MSDGRLGDDSMLDDAAIQAAIVSGTAAQLRASAPAVPLPAQRRIVERAIARAVAAGLRLPARIPISWREGRSDICHGAVTLDEAGGIHVYLSVNQGPDNLEATALHESMHVSDLFTRQPLTRVAMEKRAIAFTAKVLGWQ